MSQGSTNVWMEMIDQVPVIGFVPREEGDESHDASYQKDVADFKCRLDSSDNAIVIPFLIADFENYVMTWDNGRMIVSLVLSAHKKLMARGGGVFVCNHPAQFNPDQQGFFRMDKVIRVYHTRQEALDAVRSLIHERERG